VTTPDDPTMSHRSLDAVIASYMQAVEAGQVPNREDLLDNHPDIAEQLRSFFTDIDRMDRLASPLRMAGGIDATSGAESDGAAMLPTVRYFGDYELLEEVARGGMGVVYKARQTSLNRIVALKMILRGTFASSRDVQRFRAEAESAANLDHPHIVPIYEVGEHEGQQYFSMKLVEGASLAKLPQGDARSEIGRFVDVVRAVHYAHQHAVIHRDLKPSNVLVDPRGSWFVTDFGLAKRLSGTVADHSLTEPGQVVGTPRYMPPEQAAGRKDLTVAADVYSLGVILYERLTGRTPFLGENVLTVLRQVRETEPPRPSSIRPGLDRDLETVVLKCMDKEPARRYSSAEALANDLSFWLSGRPITARPVGQTERFWRWCKRNPAVAGLASSVAFALVLGAVVSGFFAVAERRGRIRAEIAEHEASAANDRTERTFAQSLVRPFNPDGDERGHEALSAPEMAALWELSFHQAEPIGKRFLDEATSNPVTARQLCARSEPALIAALGLNVEQRDRASKLLTDKLQDARLALPIKVETAFIALELEDRTGPPSEECARIVVEALSSESSDELWSAWQKHLAKSSGRIDPSNVAHVLAGVLERGTGSDRPNVLATTLADISVRMDPAEAAKLLSGTLIKATDGLARSTLASALESVLKRLRPAEAAQLRAQTIRILVSALGRNIDVNARLGIANNLAIFWGQLDAAEAAQIARVIGERLPERQNVQRWPSDVEILDPILDRMGPVEASPLCAELSRRLAVALEQSAKPEERANLAMCVAALAKRLNPSELLKSGCPEVHTLKAVFDKEKLGDARGKLAWGLAPLAERLGSEEAARICRPLAQDLELSLQTETSSIAKVAVIRGLAATATRLAPEQSVHIARFLAARMEHEGDWARQVGEDSSLVNNFYYLLGGLDASDAGKAARILTAALTQEKDAKIRSWLGAGLCLVADRMDSADAAVVCSPFVEDMIGTLTTKTHYISYLMSGFTFVASQLSPSHAARAARALVDALDSKTEVSIRDALTSALATAAGRMIPNEAAGLLFDALSRDADVGVRCQLASALATVAGRMAPTESANVCGQAAGLLSDALVKENDANLRSKLASGLELMASRADASVARRLYVGSAPLLANSITNETGVSLTLAETLAAMASRLEPAEASQILVTAIGRYVDAVPSIQFRGMKRSETSAAITVLTNALASASLQVSAAETARTLGGVAQTLTSSLERETDDSRRSVLVSALTSIADRMDPIESSRVRDHAINILLQARANELRAQNHVSIDRIAAGIISRLEPQIAITRASELSALIVREWNNAGEYQGTGGIIDASRMGIFGGGMMGMTGGGMSMMGGPTNKGYGDPVVLNMVLTDNGQNQISHMMAKMAASAGSGMEGALEAAARISAEPLPCRLSTQELVDLLKMPTCFGAARRIVLDHLGNRYGRRFVNHWAFVRYATEQKLNLDFITPPRRPQPVR
jgi:tRNA A-37 threonylcarbamoyl transferase component Bud32